MSSTDPQSPGGPHTPAQPTTQEIPVVTPAPAQPLPPHPGATPPAPVQTVHSTGPVGFVPGPPGPPSPPPPATGATSVWPESLGTGPVEGSTSPDPGRPAPRDRRALLGMALVAAALVLLQLGLTLRFGGESFWSEIPLWSAFATVCTALGLAGFASLVPGGRRLGGDTGWRVAAAGLVGLAVFWVLVVLPVVAGDRGFLLTAALGCLGAALWTGPARKS